MPPSLIFRGTLQRIICIIKVLLLRPNTLSGFISLCKNSASFSKSSFDEGSEVLPGNASGCCALPISVKVTKNATKPIFKGFFFIVLNFKVEVNC